ncbi:hypothetical protein ABKN59_010308 [Abortiporus biennis]
MAEVDAVKIETIRFLSTTDKSTERNEDMDAFHLLLQPYYEDSSVRNVYGFIIFSSVPSAPHNRLLV